MTPLRVPPSGSASRSPPSRGTQETNHSAFSQPPRPCREPAELGSAPGCYPCCSPVYHFAAEQMDDTEATFFSPSSGKMNLTKCCRHRPTRSHIHRNPEPLTEHRPVPQAHSGAQGGEWRQDEHFASLAFPRLFLSSQIRPLHWEALQRLFSWASMALGSRSPREKMTTL